MQLSKYDLIGKENIRKLIHDFYQEIQNDKLLLPMYKDDLAGAEERLHLFMIQYLGGPRLYEKQRGHPRLRIRHQPFLVNEEAKEHWLNNMRTALDKSSMETENKDFLWDYFNKTANFLKNG